MLILQSRSPLFVRVDYGEIVIPLRNRSIGLQVPILPKVHVVLVTESLREFLDPQRRRDKTERVEVGSDPWEYRRSSDHLGFLDVRRSSSFFFWRGNWSVLFNKGSQLNLVKSCVNRGRKRRRGVSS